MALVQPIPGYFAVVSVRNGREMLVREFDTVEDADEHMLRVFRNTVGVFGPRDHMMILYTPASGKPARQVIRSLNKREYLRQYGATRGRRSLHGVNTGGMLDDHVLGLWRENAFRPPDVFDADNNRMIWYGPAGPNGDYATETAWDWSDDEIKVTEYAPFPDDSGDIAYQSTVLSPDRVRAVLAARGIQPVNTAHMLRYATALGVAQLEYYGGTEGVTQELPL